MFSPSRQNLLDHIAAHVGQAEISALEFVGEAIVVDAKLMRGCGSCFQAFGRMRRARSNQLPMARRKPGRICSPVSSSWSVSVATSVGEW